MVTESGRSNSSNYLSASQYSANGGFGLPAVPAPALGAAGGPGGGGDGGLRGKWSVGAIALENDGESIFLRIPRQMVGVSCVTDGALFPGAPAALNGATYETISSAANGHPIPAVLLNGHSMNMNTMNLMNGHSGSGSGSGLGTGAWPGAAHTNEESEEIARHLSARSAYVHSRNVEEPDEEEKTMLARLRRKHYLLYKLQKEKQRHGAAMARRRSNTSAPHAPSLLSLASTASTSCPSQQPTPGANTNAGPADPMAPVENGGPVRPHRVSFALGAPPTGLSTGNNKDYTFFSDPSRPLMDAQRASSPVNGNYGFVKIWVHHLHM